jgi:uncharacterized membrane protein
VKDEILTILLVIHVFGAIVGLGFSLSYGLWIARGDSMGDAERVFALKTVSWIDNRLTTPAYVVQLITGLTMVAMIDLGLLEQFWLWGSLVLYVGVTVIAITRFAPAHRAHTAAAERVLSDGSDGARAEMARTAENARIWGLMATLLTVAIVVLMVWKPGS